MAHSYFEWVKRRRIDFGTTAGEQIVAGDPVDVGDWEAGVVQIDNLGSSFVSTNVSANVQTCVTLDQPKWENCLSAAVNLTNVAEDAVALKLEPTMQNPLRKWIRLVFIHNTTTPAESATYHVGVLLKKRTPA